MNSEHPELTLGYSDTEAKVNGPVTCLGMTFENDETRRAHFTEELRKKLQDPEFRKIEGFPIGSDEDILNLSDPPYYTACPNPWIADFIAEWEAQKPEQPEGFHYHREPFAADVSEGKNDPIYNAHSYHTKVPHKAIMRYILHYTEPGDIVFDGFCGTGMTGVAAQMCGDREVVMSLGYQVKPDGTVLQEEMDEDGKKVWRAFSKLGARRAVLNDLSPAATFIAYNYNTPVDVAAFEKEAKRILKEVEDECGWMYETRHSDGRTGKINFTIWSDVFICPDCSKEVVFWDIAVDKENDCVRENMSCPYCSAELTKRGMERTWQSSYDSSTGETLQQAKQVPVHINYSVNGKRFEKAPDEDDLNLIDRINGLNIPYWYPAVRMIEGKETRRNDPIGITHAHHFYTKRNLYALASTIDKTHFDRTLFVITAIIRTLTKMFRWAPRGKHTAGTSGTLYVPSITHEYPIFGAIERRLAIYKDWLRFAGKYESPNICMCSDSSDTTIERDSVDYVFLDPPFGSNLNYSELNFLWESWIKVATDNKPEAIENSVQNKGANEYRQLMTACFKEAYRVLKPGRWMTVEFSNTKASVWNSIQTALTDAGFIVANMAAPLYAVIAQLRDELNDVSFVNVPSGVGTILRKNKFMSVFNQPELTDTNQTTLPFKIFKLTAGDQFNDYLDTYMQGRGIPTMSEALTKRFKQSLFEIFLNATIHSQSKSGIFACGQFYPNKHRLDFTIADAGVGIRENVRRYTRKPKLNSCKAIEWAMTEGNTTKTGNQPGGLGLKLIKDFIQMNSGKIQVISRFGYYELSANCEHIQKMNNDFPGTCINIEINTEDTSSYCLKSELKSEDIF